MARLRPQRQNDDYKTKTTQLNLHNYTCTMTSKHRQLQHNNVDLLTTMQPHSYDIKATTTALRLQYYYFKTAIPMLQRQNYIRKTCGYKTKTTKLQRYIDDCSTAATQRQIHSNTYTTTSATAQP